VPFWQKRKACNASVTERNEGRSQMRATLVSIISFFALIASFDSSMAQFQAHDQCKDVLVNKVLNEIKVESDTFFWMALSSSKTQSQTSASNSNVGLSLGNLVGLTGNDARNLTSQISEQFNVDSVYLNRYSILLSTGQENIIKAWSECMKDKGGGLSAYITPVGSGKDIIDLHLVYFRSPSGPELPDLRVVGDVYIDKMKFQPAGDYSCLRKSYLIRSGSECTVKLLTKSAWDYDTVIIPVSDGKSKFSVSAYIPPRPELKVEKEPWPPKDLAEDWAKAHPNNDSNWAKTHPDRDPIINSVSKYNWERYDNEERCRTAPKGWFFIEGERTRTGP
jgi:hypothetical protein